MWPEQERRKYSERQVAEAKVRARDAIARGMLGVGEICAGLVATHAVDRIVHFGSRELQEQACHTLGTVLEPFVAEVASAALTVEDSDQLSAAVNQLHILCSLCVAVLEVAEQFRELSDDLADQVVADAMAPMARDSILGSAARVVLKGALRRTLDGFWPLAIDPETQRMVQLVGLVTCPNPAEHAEVMDHCVKPLTGEFVTQAYRDWMAAGYPSADLVLAGRRPRR